jgi:hypothetical protein
MSVVEGGFPHSEILGSKLVRSSPRLIAAYHVLHRLLAPRHPPDTLIALDCSHYRCPPSLFTSAEERESLSRCNIPEDETAKPDTTFKDQLLLRTYPGTERSSLPTAGMHDHIQIFQAMSTNAQNHQTRDHPDMFPLHDVLEPAKVCVQACGRASLKPKRNLFWTRSASAIDRGDQPDFGGAGRDRTDDLSSAIAALSQLSYGPWI